MNSARLAPLPLLATLTACPGPDQNPHQLWLAPDQAETRVKLIDHEPDPF